MSGSLGTVIVMLLWSKLVKERMMMFLPDFLRSGKIKMLCRKKSEIRKTYLVDMKISYFSLVPSSDGVYFFWCFSFSVMKKKD